MSAYYVKRIYYGPVAQWIEQLPSKQLVVGSIPARATIFIDFSPLKQVIYDICGANDDC